MTQGDHASAQCLCPRAFAGRFQNLETIAADFVQNQHQLEPSAELVEPLPQQIDRIAAAVHDVPPRQRDAKFLRNTEHIRILEPSGERLLCLCGEVDQNAPLRIFDGGLHDGVQAVMLVEHGWRGIVSVKA